MDGKSKNIANKIGIFLVTMFILSVTVFYLSVLAPGDPLQAFYGEGVDRLSEVQQLEARRRLGLDGPIYLRYGHWLVQAVQGNFGLSLQYKEPAINVVRAFIGNTLLLGTVSYVLVFGLAVLLAIVCTLYEDSWLDKAICRIGTLIFYLPTFWLGLLLILIFNVNLGWLPGTGAYDPGESGNIFSRLEHLLLPVTVMVLSHVWYYAYLLRNKLTAETQKDYVLLAKAKGLSRLAIVCRHCLKNVAPTLVSIIAIAANHILGGTYVVETVFAYPGLGKLAIDSAKCHDHNLLMLIVLLTGALVIAAGLTAQGINEELDPRMRIREGGRHV